MLISTFSSSSYDTPLLFHLFIFYTHLYFIISSFHLCYGYYFILIFHLSMISSLLHITFFIISSFHLVTLIHPIYFILSSFHPCYNFIIAFFHPILFHPSSSWNVTTYTFHPTLQYYVILKLYGYVEAHGARFFVYKCHAVLIRSWPLHRSNPGLYAAKDDSSRCKRSNLQRHRRAVN